MEVNLCTYCGLSQFDVVGDNDYEWKMHLNSEHTFHCTLCAYLFINEAELVFHVQQKHNVTSYFTHDEIVHAKHIQRSLNTRVNGYMPAMCHHCHRMCKVKTRWKAHLQANHVYSCTRVNCGLVFAHTRKLNEHLEGDGSECFDRKRHQSILCFIENGDYDYESSIYSSSDYHHKRRKKSKYVITTDEESEMKVVSEDFDSDLNMILNKNEIKIECKEESEKVMNTGID